MCRLSGKETSCDSPNMPTTWLAIPIHLRRPHTWIQTPKKTSATRHLHSRSGSFSRCPFLPCPKGSILYSRTPWSNPQNPITSPRGEHHPQLSTPTLSSHTARNETHAIQENNPNPRKVLARQDTPTVITLPLAPIPKSQTHKHTILPNPTLQISSQTPTDITNTLQYLDPFQEPEPHTTTAWQSSQERGNSQILRFAPQPWSSVPFEKWKRQLQTEWYWARIEVQRPGLAKRWRRVRSRVGKYDGRGEEWPSRRRRNEKWHLRLLLVLSGQGKGKATQGQTSASKKGRAAGQGSGHTSKFLPLPESMYPCIPMHIVPMHVGMGGTLAGRRPSVGHLAEMAAD